MDIAAAIATLRDLGTVRDVYTVGFCWGGGLSWRQSASQPGLSGAIGFIASFGVCWLVDLAPMPDFFAGLLPTWQSAVFSFLLLGTVAVLSAVYPARQAAGIDPIEALRFEAGG